MLFNLLQAAADTAALAQTAPAQQEMKLSLIEMATKGGWLMIILLLLSMIAIYIFGSKWWMIRKAGKINKNFMRGRNYLNQLYGDSSTGPGISNQARNYQNWQSNLASARQNRTNNDATALSQLNMNKANTASTLAQGWYNYVLPVYTNRQQTLDDYDYRRYLASL